MTKRLPCSLVTRFAYAVDARYVPVLLPFLLRPKRDGVTLTDEGSLVATFGPFKVATPLANVTGAHITAELPLVDVVWRPHVTCR